MTLARFIDERHGLKAVTHSGRRRWHPRFPFVNEAG